MDTFLRSSLVTVAVFKTALTMEIDRRENDEKVLALNVQMKDMMRTLLLYVFICCTCLLPPHNYSSTLHRLERIANPSSPAEDGLIVADRMADRMVQVRDTIQQCAHVSDSYQKKNIAREFSVNSQPKHDI